MKLQINLTDLIEKYGYHEISYYMNRDTNEYKDLCKILDYAFAEEIDSFIYYSKILFTRFNMEDRSGGFIEQDKEKMLTAIKTDPILAADIIAANREQRKVLNKYPYGYLYIELLRLVLFTQLERKRENINLTIPSFIYLNDEKSKTVEYDNCIFKIRDTSITISKK